MRNAIKHARAGLLLAVSLFALNAASLPVMAQEGPADGGPFGNKPVTTPIPEPNMPALIKTFGLIESKEPVRVFVKGWRRPKKIIVNLDNNVHRLDWLKEVVPPDVQLVGLTRNDPRYFTEIKDADGVLGGCRKDSFADVGPNFHWLHNTGVGIDQCFTGGKVPPRLADGTVVISNSARLEGNSVSDSGIAMMMALSRAFDQYVKMDEVNKFNTTPYPRLWSVRGRTILVAGLGGVGSGMAEMAHGLGMRVIATNAVIPDNAPDWIEHIGLPSELGNMLGEADVVMTALPLTPETTGLFNAAMFAKFKKGAIFVNVTRGGEQVDADVIAALQSGQISSAGFDDLDAKSPLYTTPGLNVIITPHVAAQNVDDMIGRGGEQTWDVARENLKRYINGDKMLSTIDPAKGY